MTTIYFIRHAQADNSFRDGRNRPLTDKGMTDRALATAYLESRHVDAVLSSPFRRAIDTVKEYADKHGFTIRTMEGFRERKGDSDMNLYHLGFVTFMERQWADFSYTHSDGECLGDVQLRNIAALHEVLTEYENQSVVIGTHGTALSTIVNHYDKTYGFADFMAMAERLPWAVKMTFDGLECTGIERIDLFDQ